MNEMLLFEYVMEKFAIVAPIIQVLRILTAVFVILYMHYTAKYKNHNLPIVWYILGFFLPLPVAVVFAIKSKKFRHENTKVCSQCGDKYPETFTMCSRCLIDLPELNNSKRMQKKKLGRLFGVLFVVSVVAFVVTLGYYMVNVYNRTMEWVDTLESIDRIGITDENGQTVYYDKKGNTYTDPNAVVLYGKNGDVYTYIVVGEESDEDDAFYFESQVYIDQDGNEYDPSNCYVDEDGYFFYDKNYEVVWDDSGYGYDDKIDFNDFFDEESYRYYQDRYTDENGNYYYHAEDASWNEKGEIITAENDPNPPVIEVE